ncbi:MAG: hypothetical protein GY835_07610 [bacterium]|nr:hypothetical protein [bacterium]
MNHLRILILLSCLLSASCAGSGQGADEVVAVTSGTLPADGFVPGWIKSGTERIYRASDLYGHINGGAELFKEFGFLSLNVQGYVHGEEELTLEIYHMDCPTGALGIYLAQVGEENPAADLPVRHSWNPYQLSLIRGDCFVQVNNFSGDAGLLPVIRTLVEHTLPGIPDHYLGDPFTALPDRDLMRGSRRLIRGALALEPIYTLGQGDILQLAGETFAAVGNYRQSGLEPYILMRIDYPGGQAARVLENLRLNHDRYLEQVESSEDWLLLQDYRGLYVAVVRVMSGLEIVLKLNEKPAAPTTGFWLFAAE